MSPSIRQSSPHRSTSKRSRALDGQPKQPPLVASAWTKHAFTLVELLVVISIVGVMAAVLLPALAMAHQRALRTACVGNLRQVYTALNLYALDYEEAVPLGYRSGRKQWNTMIYSGTINKFVLFGLLYPAGLMDEPRVFYCPAERACAQSFNTAANPWPPGVPGVNAQSGYASHPLVDWGDEGFPPSMPRLEQLGYLALLADTVGLPDRVDSRHRDGVNALRSDGCAAWVARAYFDKPLEQCTAIGPAFNEAQSRIWESLSKP